MAGCIVRCVDVWEKLNEQIGNHSNSSYETHMRDLLSLLENELKEVPCTANWQLRFVSILSFFKHLVSNYNLFLGGRRRCINIVQNIKTSPADQAEIHLFESVFDIAATIDNINDNRDTGRIGRRRRWGVHPINQLRREHGHFANLISEMQLGDNDKFVNYTRLSMN